MGKKDEIGRGVGYPSGHWLEEGPKNSNDQMAGSRDPSFPKRDKKNIPLEVVDF